MHQRLINCSSDLPGRADRRIGAHDAIEVCWRWGLFACAPHFGRLCIILRSKNVSRFLFKPEHGHFVALIVAREYVVVVKEVKDIYGVLQQIAGYDDASTR